MTPPPENGPSVARDRMRRQNVAVPPRAQQEVESRRRDRSNHEESVAQRAARAEAEARPKPSNDSDNFIFGTPIPEPSPRAIQTHNEADRNSSLAMYYLRKVATRDAKHLRAMYEKGEIGIQDLREAAADACANETPEADQSADVGQATSTAQKGKGRASGPAAESQVGTKYSGITVSEVSHPVQSKHALAAAKQAQNQANRNASQGSPLTRTDTSTIYPGKEKTYPMTPSSLPRPKASAQPTNTRPTRPGQPTHQPPASGQRATAVPNPAAARPPPHPASTRPSPRSAVPSAPRAVGKILVPATQEDRPTQQQRNPAAPGRAPAQVNNSTQDTAVRRSNNRAESRYTPINMGAQPPNRSKSNNTRTNTSGSHQHRNRPATVPNPPVEDAVDAQDAQDADDVGDIDNIDIDNAGRGDNRLPSESPNTTNRRRPCIKGHELETQDTVRKMIDTAVAYIIADGTYEYQTAGSSATSRVNLASKAWGLACQKTKGDYPMLPTHLKVLDAHVTTSRSRAKSALKPEIDKFFGFDTDNVANNAVLSKELLLDGFHQADRKNNRLDFQSEYLRRACRAVAFSGNASYGAKYPKAFSPFPVTFVAFVCTITQHIIYCYREGPFATEHLHVPMQLGMFRYYMKLLLEMEKNKENAFSVAIGTISDYCRESVAVTRVAHPVDPEPMREWSPDIAEPYECKYPEPSSGDEMDVEGEDDGAEQPEEEYEEPIAGPSRHRDAVPEDYDVPTDTEMDEDVDLDDKPVKSDNDEEELYD